MAKSKSKHEPETRRVSVYDGQQNIGNVVEYGIGRKRKFGAFDADGDMLGKFGSEREARQAVYARFDHAVFGE